MSNVAVCVRLKGLVKHANTPYIANFISVFSIIIGNDSELATENDPTEQERIMDMRFYMKQIYTIIKPVMCCIILSVLWVKLSNPVDSIFDTG